MTTDIEQELRALFRDKAGEAPRATPDVETGAPQEVLRRGRVRQVGTVVGSAAIAFAIVAGSAAGLSSLLRGGDVVGGYRDSEVFQRVASVEAFSVTSPSDWYLVNHWPASRSLTVGSSTGSATCTVDPSGTEVCSEEAEAVDPIHPQPYGLPVLQLTNEDLGLEVIACHELAADMAALYVAFDHAGAAGLPPGVDDPSFDPWPGHVSEGIGPCGPGTYAWFTVNDQPYFAWMGFGESVSAEDRLTLTEAFGSIVVDDGWEATQPGATTSAYVIAGGEYGPGDPWRLDLRYLGNSLELTLADGRGDQVLEVDESAAPLAWTGTDPIVGVVAERAAGVEFRPGTENEDFDLGQSPVAGTIVDVPPTIDAFDLDLFFIDPPAGYGELGGRVVITGSDPPSPSGTAPPVGEPRAEVVRLSGGDAEHTWIVRFTGSFEDGSACIRVRMDAEPFDPLCPGAGGLENTLAGRSPSVHSWLTSYYLRAGSVPLEVQDIRFVADDGSAEPILELQCTIGPVGWTDKQVCAMTLPGEGSGTFEYLDAEGNVVFEQGEGWDSATAEPQPNPVDLVQGGTYWAVYAWLGSGDQEAQIEEAQRYLEERGVHGVRGSLFCDEGAAEALGTSAEHKVAVYFETEEEANTFALDAGLLGHEAGPVVAKVTIACLE